MEVHSISTLAKSKDDIMKENEFKRTITRIETQIDNNIKIQNQNDPISKKILQIFSGLEKINPPKDAEEDKNQIKWNFQSCFKLVHDFFRISAIALNFIYII